MTEKTSQELAAEIASLTAQHDAITAKEAAASHFDGLEPTDDYGHSRGVLRAAGIAMEERMTKQPIRAESFLQDDFDGVANAKDAIEKDDLVGALIQLAMAFAKKAIA